MFACIPFTLYLDLYTPSLISLVPRPHPAFQRATLKSWVGPGDEASSSPDSFPRGKGAGYETR